MDATSSASMQIDNGILKGNAQMVAEWIADEAGCDTFEIVTEEAYPVDFEKTVNQEYGPR